MSVHYLRPRSDWRTISSEDLDPRDPQQDFLFGKPFPPDDVRAYWSMVPDNITIAVQWYGGLGLFEVRRVRAVSDEYAHDVVERIMANDARKLETWMSVIGRLANV